MKSLGRFGGVAAGLLFMASVACSSAGRTPVASPATSGARAPSAGPVVAARHVGKGPILDRQGCDPSGKTTVVISKGADGQPNAWRYFAKVRRGSSSVRALKCEAIDSNGDGYVDARFFYDDRGELVLEQRDLDFDGHAEVIADYSHFSAGHLVQAE